MVSVGSDAASAALVFGLTSMMLPALLKLYDLCCVLIKCNRQNLREVVLASCACVLPAVGLVGGLDAAADAIQAVDEVGLAAAEYTAEEMNEALQAADEVGVAAAEYGITPGPTEAQAEHQEHMMPLSNRPRGVLPHILPPIKRVGGRNQAKVRTVVTC